MSEIRKKTIEGLKTGDIFTITRTFNENDMVRFAEITRDYNPVHLSDRFSSSKRLRGRICHGLLIGGMLTEIGGQIGWLASGMDFRFKAPVYFGDTVTCHFVITEIDHRERAVAQAEFKNQDGIVVIQASLTGILPNEHERHILKDIIHDQT